MDFKRLGNLLAVVGVLTTVVALAWLFSFFSSMVRELDRVTGGQGDASIFDAWTCLYSSSGACGLVAAAAPLVGRNAYEPMLFWFGLAGLVAGLVIRLAAKPAVTA